jgi:hypothetical protein
VAGLRAREDEIHEAVIHRALSVAPPTGREAPGYVEALRAAIPSAIEHALEAIEVGEERLPPTPAPILVQAAAAARSGVGLEAVMRRYAAGYSTMCDFLYQEMQALGGNSIQGFTVLQRELTAVFESLVVEVSAAYEREERRPVPSPRQRELERIRRLLAGELVDPQGLEYPLGGHHLGVIIAGAEPEAAASALAERLDRRLLVGESGVGSCAVWLGGSRPLDPDELSAALRASTADGIRLALGEPGTAIAGWRRTRRQAEAAYLVAERCKERVVRYREIALAAAAIRDRDLHHYLTETYVEPLEGHPSALIETLRALLERGGNASSAGAALGVARQTVTSRLRIAEELLGRSAEDCASQLETALRLAALGD